MTIKEYLINLELEKLNNHIKKLEKFNAPKTQIELLKTVKKENIENGKRLKIKVLDKTLLEQEITNIEVVRLYQKESHLRFNKDIHFVRYDDCRKEIFKINDDNVESQYIVIKTIL